MPDESRLGLHDLRGGRKSDARAPPSFVRLLPLQRRRRFAPTLVLMLAGAAAELKTVDAALPFLALAANPRASL